MKIWTNGESSPVPKPSKVIRSEINHCWTSARMYQNEMDTIEEFFGLRIERYRALWTEFWNKRNHACFIAQLLHVDLSAAERREAAERK